MSKGSLKGDYTIIHALESVHNFVQDGKEKENQNKNRLSSKLSLKQRAKKERRKRKQRQIKR